MKPLGPIALKSRLNNLPVRGGVSLRIRKPAAGAPLPNRVPLPQPLELTIDIVGLLLEERQNQR